MFLGAGRFSKFHIFFGAFAFVLLLSFQNCGSQLSTPSTLASLSEEGTPQTPEEEVHSCPEGKYVSDEDEDSCVDLDPGEPDDDDSPEIPVCKQGFVLSGKKCVPEEIKCAKGEVLVGKKCLPKTVDCEILNGEGQRKRVDGELGSCNLVKCNKKFREFNNICVRENAPTVTVDYFVLHRNDGTGNAMWDKDYIDGVTEKLSLLSQGSVAFRVGTIKALKSTKLFDSRSQSQVGSAYLHLKEFTKITAVVSHPYTTDSLGLALNVRYNYEPFFVLRSKYNNGSQADMTNTAKVFLHELGHNMGMVHNYDQDVHMDNFYRETPEVLVEYIRGLINCKTSACQNLNRK